MKEVFKSMPDGVSADYLARYGDRVSAAEEYAAKIAEGDIEPTIWQKIKAIIKNAFRAMGIDLRMTDADIVFMLCGSKTSLNNERIQHCRKC